MEAAVIAIEKFSKDSDLREHIYKIGKATAYERDWSNISDAIIKEYCG